MPSQHQMVPRIARAVERLDAAATTLAEQFRIERTPVLPGRDPELQRVREQEAVADLLEELIGKLPGSVSAHISQVDHERIKAQIVATHEAEFETLKGEHADCLAKLELVCAERDASVAELNAMKSANDIDSELPTPAELAARTAEASAPGAKAEDVSTDQLATEQANAKAKRDAELKAKAEAEAKAAAKAKKGSA